MTWSAALWAGALSAVLSMRVAAAENAEGTLNVKTQPEGLEVWLDDKYIGDSPIVDKKLKSGRYTLKLIDAVQHTSVTEDLFIQPGEATTVEKTVAGKYGSLHVNSDPDGADVSVSTSLGKTPLANDFMTPGKYRLEIRAPSAHYKPSVEEIVLPRGETVNLTKKLDTKKILDTKAVVRLGLGAGAVGSFVWALVEQGNVRANEVLADSSRGAAQSDYHNKANGAAVQRTIGIVLGSVCVVAFEIVAFF